MGWIDSLYRTYEIAAEHDADGLLPVGHSTQNAHVEVSLNSQAEFVSATHVAAKESETIIPVTEDSASRGAGIFPHPLFDKLKYIAGDYSGFCGEDNSAYYKAYLEGLKAWVDSEYCNDKVKIIYDYLVKDTIISDLVKANIFAINEEDRLTEKWETANTKLTLGKQKDAFIRFRVFGVDDITEVWQDHTVQEAYINYYLNQDSKDGLCYVTGKVERISEKHPSKLRNSGDKAKLISANDKEGFTYRGRFHDSNESFAISYEASQKAHLALKWLIEKQGVRIGDKVFVLWGVEGEEVPPIFENSFEFCKQQNTLDTAQNIAKSFNRAILGYKAQIDTKSTLCLIGVDAATTGRLSVVFYREYKGEQGNELIDRIKKWHEETSWRMVAWTDEKPINFVGAPSPKNIARFAFGTEQGDMVKGKDKLIAKTVERLLPCICDEKKIPRDIPAVLINKSMHPQNYSSNNWDQLIRNACAVYRKYLYDYEEGMSVSVDKNCKDLSYNCGRLLAVADAIEAWAKLSSGKKVETTNAMRYFTRFTQRPNDTWLLINDKLEPYRRQLGSKGKKLYDLLGEISDNINVDDFADCKLNGRFCLGFESQREELVKGKNKDEVKRIEEEQK